MLPCIFSVGTPALDDLHRLKTRQLPTPIKDLCHYPGLPAVFKELAHVVILVLVSVAEPQAFPFFLCTKASTCVSAAPVTLPACLQQQQRIRVWDCSLCSTANCLMKWTNETASSSSSARAWRSWSLHSAANGYMALLQ